MDIKNKEGQHKNVNLGGVGRSNILTNSRLLGMVMIHIYVQIVRVQVGICLEVFAEFSRKLP